MRVRTWLVLALALVAGRTAVAADYTVFVNDRAGFDAALASGSGASVTDTGGAFAADPVTGTVDEVVRTGTIAGQTYSYAVRDIDFSNTPNGTITPGGGVGGDVLSTSKLKLEFPAEQDGATGTGTWGVDSLGGSPSTRNALVLDFLTTPGGLGVSHVGADLIDFESDSAFTTGMLRLYDGGLLVHSQAFDLGGGDGQNIFVGVVASESAAQIDQAVFVLGDDSAGGGTGERYAADRFVFGQTVVNPEPGTWALMGLGLAALGIGARRRRRARVAASLSDLASPDHDTA